MNITITGNVGQDPELRFTAGGEPVCSFSVAENRRWISRDGEDREVTTWWPINVWGEQGEQCAESLSKGDRVIVIGRCEDRHWENDEGEDRSRKEVTAWEVAPSLRWATAVVTRAEKKGKRDDPPPPDYEEEPF